MTAKILYFGCIPSMGEVGHYMWKASGEKDWDLIRGNPWGYKVDGGLCPKGPGALRHCKDGWTCISFWDRSGDQRPGSNSNFLVQGEFSFAEMVALGRQQFPAVFARIKFEIVEVAE